MFHKNGYMFSKVSQVPFIYVLKCTLYIYIMHNILKSVGEGVPHLLLCIPPLEDLKIK